MWQQSNRGERPSREARGPKMYEQRGLGKGLSDEDLETISQLVAERSECKAVANYNRADEIFDTLQNQYNVNVDDKRAEWALLNEEYLLNFLSPNWLKWDVVKDIRDKLHYSKLEEIRNIFWEQCEEGEL